MAVNAMRTGWSLKDAAAVLGIHPNRVTQSLDPTLDRIARLWLADATRTMMAILDRVRQLDQPAPPSEPITEQELDLFRRIKRGRVDSSEIGQNYPSLTSAPRRPCSAARLPRSSFQSTAR